ncbi:hypothetical protein QNM99_25770, partial [Pseudomonas sp. PCH446]
ADIGEDEFIAQAKGAQAAIVAFNSINARVLDALPELRIVCKHGVGVDNIDLPAARERKVWICNVRTPTSMRWRTTPLPCCWPRPARSRWPINRPKPVNGRVCSAPMSTQDPGHHRAGQYRQGGRAARGRLLDAGDRP